MSPAFRQSSNGSGHVQHLISQPDIFHLIDLQRPCMALPRRTQTLETAVSWFRMPDTDEGLRTGMDYAPSSSYLSIFATSA